LPPKFSVCLPEMYTGMRGGTVSLGPAACTSYCHPLPMGVCVTLRRSSGRLSRPIIVPVSVVTNRTRQLRASCFPSFRRASPKTTCHLSPLWMIVKRCCPSSPWTSGKSRRSRGARSFPQIERTRPRSGPINESKPSLPSIAPIVERLQSHAVHGPARPSTSRLLAMTPNPTQRCIPLSPRYRHRRSP